MVNPPVLGKSTAVPVDQEALEKDIIGFTHPNLHRRIIKWSKEYAIKPVYLEDGDEGQGVYLQDSKNRFSVLVAAYKILPSQFDIEKAVREFITNHLPGDELRPRDYELQINGVDSYRTVSINTHDEESTSHEIP